ncbi:UDP-N-acetyl-D-galactosamine dehydrogenase [Halanaerobium congolense]|jgi:UDP-N-acetyl-D-galactosamine dehydrogenase|uniref:UDP-N-acetyl-D-galactosamine dehydrogenase n=1 Tax=Halanaerobium congolense TaxID=54121 RepID=A0A318DYT2_9FIRM|nr:nucleotide sugar dehydrogenase [Halanaerobium congolense]PXV63078.1 UDP-N-acetyl-D-galactosamine dehydrogenase [Halanaerobium congolense]
MNLYQEIKDKKEKISVVGLGYVGMPLAIAFAKKAEVIGVDINSWKIEQYHKGIDVTNEVGDKALKETTAHFTDDTEALKDAKFHVVAVPTPINGDKSPNLDPVIGASKTVGKNLTKGSIVVYESTVYPGVTEDICIPILEEESGLKCGEDFKVGYSPERINPGDKVHRLETIVKIVSGMDDESLDIIAKTYEMIIEAGVHRAESIKVAEAAKVIENSQRDINIAFMNELAIVFDKMGINTDHVLKAAGTKWNFLNFTPGLVGGHCIGVDPNYFIYRAEQLGYHSQIILSGRKINEQMAAFVAENTVKKLIKADKKVKGAKVGIMGVTFKENCPDVRNSKVLELIEELDEYEIETVIYDPVADQDELKNESEVELSEKEELTDLDAVIFAVAHNEFKDLTIDEIDKLFLDEKIMIDVKTMFEEEEMKDKGYTYWNL